MAVSLQIIQEIIAFFFVYCFRLQTNPNAANINIIADLYAEVIGVLSQARSVSTETKIKLK